MTMQFLDSASADQRARVQPGWIDLQQLVGRCMGNLALADQIILKFLSSLEDKISNLKTAAREQDLEDIRRIAHRLKGEALTLGASEIAELAAKTETAAKEGIEVASVQYAQQLATTCEKVRHEAFTFGSLKD